MLALVDCNSCYASCEQIFRPDLRGKPVVVLSNNDGCIVARSAEAKKLGIPDLQPFFKIEPLLRRHNVAIFSSNYPLYGDISNRVMTTLQRFSPSVEVYSIDEMFLDLAGIQEPLTEYGKTIKQTVLKHVGMPVSVGIAPTKTLAKLANKAAKSYPHCEGVCLLDTPQKWQWLQRKLPVNAVWGVGSKLAKRLADYRIHTALDLATAHAKTLRRHLSVQIERTINELNGIPSIPFEEEPPAKQQIYSSRSFGEKLTELEPIKQAVAAYASRAAEKLRKQNYLAKSLHIMLQTSPHQPNYYSKSMVIELPYWSDDTALIVRAAQRGIENLYREGFHYLKAGVGIIQMHHRTQLQLDIFQPTEDHQRRQLMTLIDQINQHHGRSTVHLATEGFTKKWAMRQRYRSPTYTTRWRELPKIRIDA